MVLLYKKRLKEIKPKNVLFSKGVFLSLDKKLEDQTKTILFFASQSALDQGKKTISSKDIDLAFSKFYESYSFDYLSMLENVFSEFFKTKKQEVKNNAMRRRNFEANA